VSALLSVMDLFVYRPEYKVLICRECKFAVPPDGLKTHARRVHKDDHLDLCVHGGPAAVAKKLLSQPNEPLLDPKEQWHDFLDFTPASLSVRKRTLLNVGREECSPLKKRRVHGER
jgi:hypothetical protein